MLFHLYVYGNSAAQQSQNRLGPSMSSSCSKMIWAEAWQICTLQHFCSFPTTFHINMYITLLTGQLWWLCQTQLLLSLCWSPEASPCVLSVIFTEKGTLQMRGNSPTPTNGNVKLINLKQGNMVTFRPYRVICWFLIKSWGKKENTFVVLQCYLYFKHSDSKFKLPWQLRLMHI